MLSKLKKLLYILIDQENQRPVVYFEYFISTLIILNAITAGIMLSQNSPALELFDSFCIIIFSFEIIVRYVASPSAKKFFKDPIQIFDILIIASCLIPESFISNNSMLMCLRVIRLLRITRFISLNREMSTIIRVLLRSIISLYRIMALFLVFTYVFSVIGMSLFRMPAVDQNHPLTAAYTEFEKESNNYFVGEHIDPFGSISESMFSLLKVVSGDDWCNFRNNLILASQKGVIVAPCWVVTFYFTFWFIFGAYLLLNLVVGAILQNYEDLYNRINNQRVAEEREQQINTKVRELVSELLKTVDDGKLTEDEKQLLLEKAMDIAKR